MCRNANLLGRIGQGAERVELTLHGLWELVLQGLEKVFRWVATLHTNPLAQRVDVTGRPIDQKRPTESPQCVRIVAACLHQLLDCAAEHPQCDLGALLARIICMQHNALAEYAHSPVEAEASFIILSSIKILAQTVRP